MSRHSKNRNNIGSNPQPTPTRMTAVLDQLATDANTQRREDPNMATLEPRLRELNAEFRRLCGHLDDETTGAAIMVVGQLLAGYVNAKPDTEAKIEALASLPNLMRLAGAELYAGTTTEVQIGCPFTYLNGTPCTKTVAAATQGHADLLMKGHVWQAHPDEEWPPTQDDDEEDVADAVNLAPTDPAAQAAAIAGLEAEFPDNDDEPHLCACGKRAEVVVGTINTPDGEPGEAKAMCRDCARIERLAPNLNAKHAPHELCDCRPGEVYHCAAVTGGEVEG